MSDTLMTIIGIFLAVILMFIFPLMELAGKNDEIAQTVTEVAVSDFVNKVAEQGKITQFDYNALVQQLYATGNAYDIQIEAKILDDNPRRATTTAASDLLGEYKYYSVYTNTILEEVNKTENGEYLLKKDDYVIVTVKNTNITLGTQLKNFLYKLIGKDTYTIGTSSSALVLNGGNDEVEPEIIKENTPTYPEKAVKIITKEIIYTSETIIEELDTVVILDCETQTMPWHNNYGDSQYFVKNIISGMEGKGELVFILSSNPETIYSNLEDVKWVTDAKEDMDSRSYRDAFITALNWVENKSRERCIVFLSYHPEADYLKDAISTLKTNSSKYDIFYTTECCGDMSAYASQWHDAIPEEKLGGHLHGSDINSKFSQIGGKITEEEQTIETSRTSTDLVIPLDGLDIEKDIFIKVNKTLFTVGQTIPEYIIYKNNAGEYVLDLKILSEILDMTSTEWENAVIELEYTKTS